MYLRTETIEQKKLLGFSSMVTLVSNPVITPQLWKQLMPRRHEFANRVSYYSVQVFENLLAFKDFGPDTPFRKWAAVEVLDFEQPVIGMEKLVITGAKYAIFLHRGLPSDFPTTLKYIFESWLPNWIPIRATQSCDQ